MGVSIYPFKNDIMEILKILKFEFVGLAIFLEEKLGIKVDVVPYNTVRDELKEGIFKEAVHL